MSDTLISFLLQTLCASLLSLVGFIIIAPSKIGLRWLNYIFEEELERFKAEQNLSLERIKGEQNEKIEALKERLAHSTDRGRLSAEREYIAITAAWEAFVSALMETRFCVANFLQHPDLDRLKDDELEQFLQTTQLSTKQIDWVKDAADKNRAFSNAMQLRQIANAGKAIWEARTLLRMQALYIPKSLRELIDEKLQLCIQTQVEQSMIHTFPEHWPIEREKSHDFVRDSEVHFEQVLTAARNRMLRDDKSEP